MAHLLYPILRRCSTVPRKTTLHKTFLDAITDFLDDRELRAPSDDVGEPASGRHANRNEHIQSCRADPVIPFVKQKCDIPQPPAPRLLYDRKEAARQLSISVRSLAYLIANKMFQTRRIGKKVLIPMRNWSAMPGPIAMIRYSGPTPGSLLRSDHKDR
jgi:hypothetical protein